MSNRTGVDAFAMVAARHAMTSSEISSENYGALPSSYRRVRKSKSFVALHNGNLRLRIQRSLPFLRRQSTATFHKGAEGAWERHEEAVQLARAQYFGGSDHQDRQEVGHERLQNGNRREHRMFRKSVRANVILDADQPAAITRSSSFSTTLRNRVRKVIGKTLSRKDGLPPQHLEAQRCHFSELDRDAGLASGFDAYQITEDTPRKGECFPTVSEHDHDPLEELDKLPGTLHSAASRESLHSNARSRVTSWSNSSMTGSIGLRSGPLEPNRLSIIKEDGGPHQPSSSAGRHIGGVEVSREPLQSVTNDGLVSPAINSQRIYSALIKRINQEEAEVEKTRIAVATINQERKGTSKDLLGAKSTIRAVHSDSSLATVTTDQPTRRSSSRSGPWNWGRDRDQAENVTMDARHKENGEKRRERLVGQESQSSFYPFSSEKNPNTPSPFKKFLNERRHRTRSRSRSSSRSHRPEADGDSTSVIINRQPSNPVMTRPRLGLSSASVYSRTTNGGSNEQYQRPIDSSEELLASGHTDSESMGMATILPATHASYDQGQWNPWSDARDQIRHAPDRNSHTRENAQIGSEENVPDGDEVHPDDMIGRYPLNDRNATSASRTAKVHIVIDPSRAHNQLLRNASTDALSNISNKAEDGSKGSGSLRKLSPGNLAKMFKDRKSQRQTRPQSAGKENSPAAQDDSPPISTPGRLHLQFRNGASTGRLRKKASETGFYARAGVSSTPHGSISTTPSRSHESPSENAKNHLVARLSRPFNMDVPTHNRPFDSMYLGKRTPGHPDTFGVNRLSVAPRISEDRPDLNNEAAEEHETTALPPDLTLLEKAL